MTDILTMREYSRYSLDELVDMIKRLENRIAELEGGANERYDEGFRDGVESQIDRG